MFVVAASRGISFPTSLGLPTLWTGRRMLRRQFFGATIRRMSRAAKAPPRRNEPEFWTNVAQRWEAWESVVMAALAPIDPVLMRTTGLAVGDRVVDFGCGSGEPSLALARYVGPKGQVLGVDVSAPMLEVARRRARMAQLDNVGFRRGDLAAFRHRGSRFDVAVSRFALMFVSDLDAALGNVRDALGRDGRAAFAVWGSLEQNPSIAIRARLRRHFNPGPVPDPETIPHPLRLARPGRLAGLMRRAGFEEVREEGVHAGTAFASLDDCVRMQYEVAMSDLYDTLSPTRRRALRDGLRRGFSRFFERGIVRVPGFALVVSGRR
jgi:SAM-dependent methyltransferase